MYCVKARLKEPIDFHDDEATIRDKVNRSLEASSLQALFRGNKEVVYYDEKDPQLYEELKNEIQSKQNVMRAIILHLNETKKGQSYELEFVTAPKGFGLDIFKRGIDKIYFNATGREITSFYTQKDLDTVNTIEKILGRLEQNDDFREMNAYIKNNKSAPVQEKLQNLGQLADKALNERQLSSGAQNIYKAISEAANKKDDKAIRRLDARVNALGSHYMIAEVDVGRHNQNLDLEAVIKGVENGQFSVNVDTEFRYQDETEAINKYGKRGIPIRSNEVHAVVKIDNSQLTQAPQLKEIRVLDEALALTSQIKQIDELSDNSTKKKDLSDHPIQCENFNWFDKINRVKNTNPKQAQTPSAGRVMQKALWVQGEHPKHKQPESKRSDKAISISGHRQDQQVTRRADEMIKNVRRIIDSDQFKAKREREQNPDTKKRLEQMKDCAKASDLTKSNVEPSVIKMQKLQALADKGLKEEKGSSQLTQEFYKAVKNADNFHLSSIRIELESAAEQEKEKSPKPKP